MSIALVLVHVVATCFYFPPAEAFSDRPLFERDHPVHSHRVFVYRQALIESGRPWGYDPAVGTGLVVGPLSDIGARPQQVLGTLLPFLSPTRVVRLFAFLTILLFPLGTMAAARQLGFEPGARAWTLLATLVILWLSFSIRAYVNWGLSAFVAGAGLVPWLLAAFLAFLKSSNLARYLVLITLLTTALLLHPQAAWAVAPALLVLTLLHRPLSWRWRLALMISPVAALALNSFWLVPALWARQMPDPPGVFHIAYSQHLTFADWQDLRQYMDWTWVVSRVLAVLFALTGLRALSRSTGGHAALAWGLALAWTAFLAYPGSLVETVRVFQPVRFNAPLLSLLALPLGLTLHAVVKRLEKFQREAALVGTVLLATAIALFAGEDQRFPLNGPDDSLTRFLQDTNTPDDRLAIQSSDGYLSNGYEARVLPQVFDREVIGSTFPHLWHPAQFLRPSIFGRLLEEWSPVELAAALDRWGISWALARTDEAKSLLARATSSPGEVVGDYVAFHIEENPGRFLVGTGAVDARVNRIDLEDVEDEDGLVVLRYRYHPAWVSSTGIPVESYPVPEDPAGFIALRNPPQSITLRFDPMLMLTARWP